MPSFSDIGFRLAVGFESRFVTSAFTLARGSISVEFRLIPRLAYRAAARQELALRFIEPAAKGPESLESDLNLGIR
jgi:hypothetical protein